MKPFFTNAIAVTGGFCSGKSTVAEKLAKLLEYCFFSADREVAYLLEKNAAGWSELQKILNPAYFLANGEINKPMLRQTIFTDKNLCKKVESTLHPMVRSKLKCNIDKAFINDGKKSIVEVPLLYEANWQDDFGLVIVVSVTEQTAIKRALKRDGVKIEQAKQAVSAQFSLKEKVLLADYVIDNEKSRDHTIKQLAEFKKILKKS